MLFLVFLLMCLVSNRQFATFHNHGKELICIGFLNEKMKIVCKKQNHNNNSAMYNNLEAHSKKLGEIEGAN